MRDIAVLDWKPQTRLSSVFGVCALVAGAAGCFLAAQVVDSRMAEITALAATGALGAAALFWLAGEVMVTRRTSARVAQFAELIEPEPAFSFICDPEGCILAANAMARERFSPMMGARLAEVLGDVFASAEGVLYRIQHRAVHEGAACEDITSHAEGFRVFARAVDGGVVVWRLETRPGAGLQTVVDQAVVSVERNGAIIYMNAQARALLGRPVRKLDEIIDDLPLRPGSVHRLTTTGESLRKVLVQASDLGAGRQEVMLSLIEEPPAKPEATESFDGLPVPLLKVTPEGQILNANPEARRLLDLPTGQNGHIAEHMEGLGRPLQDWLQEAAEGRGLHRSEFLRLTRPDSEVFVQVTLKRTQEGGQTHLIAVLNDATELKTLEAQFVQSQKMQAIGQLAGGVAHDFNNLLTAISGHCDLLLLRHDQGDPEYADLVQINQNANRAASLVGQLLAFSRKQTLQPETLDLRDTLSELTHLLNRLVGERVRLTLRHDPVLPAVRGDRRQLEQVLMNLVVNARDAMPDGGEIVVETERRVLREAMKRDRAIVAPGTYVSVRVVDEGTGIPADKLQKVFEPFFTTKRPGEGTGLGLSTVYGIVKQTGGFIFVDSVMGQGTCFTLLLPAYEAPAESAVQIAKSQDPQDLLQKSGGVVLLVEDEAPVRAFAARALRLRGYTVIEADTAETALETLEDRALDVDLFVTDVVMPGMDGPSWVRKAREDRPDTRVVFVSGYAEDAFGEGSEEIPNSVFLPKPFSLAELTETVNRQLS
ncbi:ATP-binding protein [Sagittula sp. SSi028]|uniref:ATP-binding protein n=1 Tax=Sagittula sp. SSi028 TaxID=3400636 RepID=UPI003AF550C3